MDTEREISGIQRVKVRISSIEVDDDPIKPDYVRLRVTLSCGETNDPWNVKVNDSKTNSDECWEWLDEIESDFYSLEGKRLTFREMRTLRETNDFVFQDVVDYQFPELYLLTDCKVTRCGTDNFKLYVVDADGEVISNEFFVRGDDLRKNLVTKQ